MDNVRPNAQIAKADALYANGRMDEALEAYKVALEENPDLAWAHSRIGGILAQRGDLTAAEVSLNKALELDPELPQAHSNLGNLCYTRKDYEQAVIQYRAAIALDPTNPVYHENLHAAYKQLKRVPEAVAALKQAHRLKRERTKDEVKGGLDATKTQIKRKFGCMSTLVVLTAVLVLAIAAAI